MKKVISIICVCLICVLSFYGCGGNNSKPAQESTAPAFADTTSYSAETTTAFSAEQVTEATTTAATVSETTTAATVSDTTAATASENGNNFNMTIGKIQSVEGNTVTVLLADTENMFSGNMPNGGSDGSRPEFPGGKMPEDFESFFGSKNESSGSGLSGIIGKLFGSDSESGNRPQFPGGEMPEGFDFSNMPEGFDPNNMPEGFSGEIPEGFDPSNMPEDFKDFSGMTGNFDVSSLTFGTETATYTIPQDLKIGDSDYTSLKADNIIMIMLDAAGAVTAVTVVG